MARFIVTVSPTKIASLSLITDYGFKKIGEHIDEVDGLEHIFLRDCSPSPLAGEGLG